MRRILAALLMLLPVAALAQDTAERDRGILQAFLEDNLSGAGRDVRIEGFAGALSSRATFDTLTIADDRGIWLTIRNGALSWNRQALFAGRVEVNELAAAEIDMPRRPDTGNGGWSSASGFTLPDLPVAIQIGALRVDQVALGPDVLGEAVRLSVSGAMQLAGGEGSANLSTTRIDGKQGQISLAASFANATRAVSIDLLAEEGADGLAVNLLEVPGRPPVLLAVNGSGTADNLGLDLALSTDGVRRLSGKLSLATDTSGEPGRRFTANLSGDLAPLFLPEYREFFGNRIALVAEGTRSPSGRLVVPKFTLTAASIGLSGSLAVASDGLPEDAQLAMTLGAADGGEILLPIPGQKTWVSGGDLDLGFGRAADDGWSLKGRVSGLRRAGVTVGTLRIDGSGRSGRTGAHGIQRNMVGGTLYFTAGGIDPDDPKLAAAVGPFLTGKTIFSAEQGRPLRLSRLAATGQGYALDGNISVGSLAEGFPITGRATATLRDAARLSQLRGRNLGGAAILTLQGNGSPLAGTLDATAVLSGLDFSVGQAEADRLLAGRSEVTASVLRTETGTTLRSFTVDASTLSASASGTISANASDMTGRIALSDLSRVRPGARGSITGDFTVTGPDDDLLLTLAGRGSDLAVGQAQADRILRGQTALSASARLRDGEISLRDLTLGNPQVQVSATPAGAAGTALAVSGRLADTALVAPGFPGPLTVSGTVTPGAGSSALDLTASGPGGTDLSLRGNVGGLGSDLAIRGSAQAALANAFIAPRTVEGPVSFDLSLRGRPALTSLGGTVALRGGRISAPTFRLAFEGVNATATLSGGRASIDASATLRDGGTVTVKGPVDLAQPRTADLTIVATSVRLRDPNLYQTTATGTLAFRGPLGGGGRLSGAIALGETEIRIPSTGFGTNPVTTGIIHRNDSAAARETRARAGLDGAPGSGTNDQARPIALDLTVNAPSRVFVRGRGLDAELGGTLRIGGTTAAAAPSGQFNLIRGRLDLLGKRFVMDEGLVQLQGALVPFVRFAASTTSDSVTSTILVEGLASEPRISFTSSPSLPEEEIVARLLFARDLTSLSVFQAAQLASAIASLTGRGGEGLVSSVRKSLGLDDFDIQSDGEGAFGLRAGKYLTRNIYTDVTVNNDGQSEIRLNLDVTSDVTLRGRLDTAGETGIGVYYERDY